MEKSRLTEEQALGLLRQVAGGRTIAAVCREHGSSGATYRRRKGKSGGLEEENRERKQPVGEPTLADAALKDVAAERR